MAVRYGTGLNTGPGIGMAVGGGGGETMEDEPARNVLGPDTEAGQAILVVVIAFVVMWIAVGPGGGLVGRAGRVLTSIALVAAAVIAANFMGRTYALRHPNAPLAAGIAYDL